MPKKTIFFLLSLLLLLGLAGCGGGGGKVDTLLTLDASCAGERAMTLSLPGIDPEGDSGLQMDALLNAVCPKELTYSKQAGGYRFSLRFSSYGEYLEKLTVLLGREPGVIFAMPDTVLASGYRLQEDFDSAGLFGWLKTAAAQRGLLSGNALSLSCGSTAVTLGKHTQTTASSIGLNHVEGYPIDGIEISTLRRRDGGYDRSVTFSIPRATSDALGDDLVSYMNARTPRRASGVWEDYASGRRYTVTMTACSLSEIKQATNLLFNAPLTGDVAYGKNEEASTPFTEVSAFEETIDLSGYLGARNGDVSLTYRYAAEDGAALSMETMQEGSWKPAGTNEETACVLSQNSAQVRVRVPEETVHALEKTSVILSCEGKGSFTRTVEFLFAPEDTLGPQYAAGYFSRRNTDSTIGVESTEAGGLCKIVMTGNAEELTAQAAALFGEGNALFYESEGGAAEVHKKTALTDTMKLAHLYTGGQEKKPITYTIQTNGKERLDQLEQRSENHSAKIRLDQGQEGEVTFELQSGDTEIVYNGNTPNWFGVTLALLGTAAVIALAVFVVFRVRKGGGKKGPPRFRRPATEFDPNESIEDILADL